MSELVLDIEVPPRATVPVADTRLQGKVFQDDQGTVLVAEDGEEFRPVNDSPRAFIAAKEALVQHEAGLAQTNSPANLADPGGASHIDAPKPELPSDPWKQHVAGLSDITTNAMMVLGMRASAIDAGVSTLGTDEPFTDAFAKSASTDYLLNRGTEARGDMNALLGVMEPESREDIAARALGEFFPVLGPASGISKLGNFVKGASNVLTNAVKPGPGVAGRAIAQEAIGLPIDTGVREYLDFPSIISPGPHPLNAPQSDVIKGGTEGDTLAAPPDQEKVLAFDPQGGGFDMDRARSSGMKRAGPEAGENEGHFGSVAPVSPEEAKKFNLPAGSFIILKGRQHPTFDKAIEAEKKRGSKIIERGGRFFSVPPDSGLTLNIEVEDLVLGDDEALKESDTERALRFHDLWKLDNDIDRIQWEAHMVSVAATIAAIAGSGVAARMLYKGHQAAQAQRGVFGAYIPNKSAVGEAFDEVLAAAKQHDFTGMVLPLKKGAVAAGRELDVMFSSAGKSLAYALKDLGYPKELIDQFVANMHSVNPSFMAREFWATGKLGQGTGISVPSGASIEQAYNRLSQAQQKLFNEGEYAASQLAIAANAAPGTTVWKKGLGPQKLAAMRAAARADDDVRKLSALMARNYEGQLHYMLKRGMLDQEGFDMMRRTFKEADGSISYMPMLHNEADFVRMIARRFGGWDSSANVGAKEAWAQLKKRQAGTGTGTQFPMTPIEALRAYTAKNLAITNMNAFQSHALSRLAGIEFFNGTFRRVGVNLQTGARFPITLGASPQTKGVRDVTYLGHGDPQEGDVFKVLVPTDDPALRNLNTKLPDDPDVDNLKAAFPDGEVMVVQRDGRNHLFHVPDLYMRRALELQPRMGSFVNFLAHWRNVAQANITGQYSAFSPLAAIYNMEQIWLLRSALEGTWGGITSLKDSAKGILSMQILNNSQVMANYFSEAVTREIQQGRTPPQWLTTMQKRLEKFHTDSWLHVVSKETGAIRGAMTFTGEPASLQAMMDGLSPNYIKAYGALELATVWKFWKAMNNAFHEGPTAGQYLKEYGELMEEAVAKAKGAPISPEAEAQIARTAMSNALKMTGDIGQVGASNVARVFNKTFLYSGPFVAGLRAIGKGAASNPKRFAVGLATVIGIPTTMELLNNALIGAAHDEAVRRGEAEPWVDHEGKIWTYEDWFYNGLTTHQRVSNRYLFLPGLAPWKGIVIPTNPEFGVMRAALLDGLDMIFDLGNRGEKTISSAGHPERLSRLHLIVSAAREFDLPIPTLVAAALEIVSGQDITFGVHFESTPEGTEFGLSHARPKTGRHGTGQSAEPSRLGKVPLALVTNLWGSTAMNMVRGYEAFGDAMENKVDLGKKAPTLPDAMGRFFDAFTDGFISHGRIWNPLRQSLHPGGYKDPISEDNFLRKTNLMTLMNDARGYIEGTLTDSRGFSLESNSGALPDDPIWITISLSAKQVLADTRHLDQEISDMKLKKNRLSHSTNESLEVRRSKIDAAQSRIQTLHAQQNASFITFELQLEKLLSEKLGREPGDEVRIDLRNVSSLNRAQLPPTDSAKQRLQK
jgi:hypothetical protein